MVRSLGYQASFLGGGQIDEIKVTNYGPFLVTYPRPSIINSTPDFRPKMFSHNHPNKETLKEGIFLRLFFQVFWAPQGHVNKKEGTFVKSFFFT